MLGELGLMNGRVKCQTSQTEVFHGIVQVSSLQMEIFCCFCFEVQIAYQLEVSLTSLLCHQVLNRQCFILICFGFFCRRLISLSSETFDI